MAHLGAEENLAVDAHGLDPWAKEVLKDFDETFCSSTSVSGKQEEAASG